MEQGKESQSEQIEVRVMEQVDKIINCIDNAKKRGDNCCLIDGEEYIPKEVLKHMVEMKYNVNVFVKSDNTFILEIKWDDDVDGTLTAMFSENYTEQMLVTVDELYEKLSKKKISQVNFKKLNDEQLANYYVHLMESGTEESPDEKLQIQIEMVDRFVEKFADKKVDEILNNRKNMLFI